VSPRSAYSYSREGCVRHQRRQLLPPRARTAIIAQTPRGCLHIADSVKRRSLPSCRTVTNSNTHLPAQNKSFDRRLASDHKLHTSGV
jgi:ribonucleotide reductase alpha subunit